MILNSYHKLICTQLCEYRNVNMKNKVEFPIISKPKPCIHSSVTITWPVFLARIYPLIHLCSTTSKGHSAPDGAGRNGRTRQFRAHSSLVPQLGLSVKCPHWLWTLSPQLMILLLEVVESLEHGAMLEEVDLEIIDPSVYSSGSYSVLFLFLDSPRCQPEASCSCHHI